MAALNTSVSEEYFGEATIRMSANVRGEAS